MNHLSNSQQTRLLRALKVAELSSANQRHGAVIYKGGSVLSLGVNTVPNDHLSTGEFTGSPNTHAETQAIRACGPDVDLSNTTLYVARVNKNGIPMFSKPCKTCQEAIDLAGIKKVIYTTAEGAEIV